MVDVLGLEIGVAVKIVSEEPHSLHKREHTCSIRQILLLHVSQEAFGGLDISTCERLEDIHIETDLGRIRLILRRGIGRSAQEITEIREHKARHHSVQVDDTQDVAILVEHHVIDLGIAVADTFRQLPVAIHTLRLAHLFTMLVDIIQHCHYLVTVVRVISNRLPSVAIFRFINPAAAVIFHGVDKLSHTEFHIMEIRNCLAELGVEVRKH